MIIQLKTGIAVREKDLILARVSELGYKTNLVTTQKGEYIVCIGKKDFDIRQLGNLEGITDIHRVSDDYKLVSRKWKVDRTQIDLGGTPAGLYLVRIQDGTEEKVYRVVRD